MPRQGSPTLPPGARFRSTLSERMARVLIAERAQLNLRAMIRTHSLPTGTPERVQPWGGLGRWAFLEVMDPWMPSS